MIKFLTSEETIVILLSLILLVCSYGPLAYQYLFPPSGKVFLGTFGFPPDFFGNLISFQEGRLGHWQHIAKLTSTLKGKPAFIRSEYNLLGQLSRLFPLNPVVFFHLCRLILSIIFISLIYWLITKTFKKKSLRLVAFSMALFSTTLDPSAGSLTDLWSPLQVFERTAYYPHYLFSFIFILLAIYFLSQSLTHGKFVKLVLASFFGFLAALTHPPTIIVTFLGLPVYFFVILGKQRRVKLPGVRHLLKKLVSLGFFSLISSLPLFYLLQLSSTYPYNLLTKIDLLFDISSALSPLDFFLGIGPMAVLAIIGSFLAIKKATEWLYLLIPWSITYILGFFFLWKIIGYNSARFLQTPFFVFLGILSTFTLNAISEWMAKIWPQNKERILYLIVLFLLALNLPAYYQSLKDNMRNLRNFHPYIDSPVEKVTAVNWLFQNTQEDEVVLSSGLNGMLVAALVGNMPYFTTHAWQLDNASSLQGNVKNFFSQNWPEAQAKKFVAREKIRLVFFGQEEKEMTEGKDYLDYSFLKPIFQNQKVTIYQVIESGT